MSQTTQMLVTGASRGIGRAIALHQQRAGVQITGTSRDISPLNTELTPSAGNLPIIWHALDLDQPNSDIGGLDHFADQIYTAYSGIVLNATTSSQQMLHASSSGAIAQQIQVALTRQLELLARLIADNRLAPEASIVFIGSNLARNGLAGKVAYSAAKAGLEGATRALAHEYGNRGWRFNTIAPGLIRTDMTSTLSNEDWQRYEASVPLRRAGTVEDIADAADFFLSSKSRYITGQVLDIDGGWGI